MLSIVLKAKTTATVLRVNAVTTKEVDKKLPNVQNAIRHLPHHINTSQVMRDEVKATACHSHQQTKMHLDQRRAKSKPDKSAIIANSSIAMCSAISDAAELVQLFMSNRH